MTRAVTLTRACFAMLLLGVASLAAADTYTVNSIAADDDGACEPAPGDCTLVEAVDEANARTGPDIISFADLPGSAPWRIALSGSFLVIRDDDTTLDGWTAPGWIDAPLVEIVGAGVQVFNADNAVIRGFAFSGANSSSVDIQGGTGSMIAGNYIGTDVTGTRNLGSGSSGISALRTTELVIGTDGDGVDDALEGNIIVGATSTGIILNGSFGQQYTDNVIAGNLIGTGMTGTEAFGNSTGILINVNSFQNLRIGTNGDGVSDVLERNVIADNATNGIWDIGTDTQINGNLIGTDINGCAALGNGQAGIRSDSNTTIGGETRGMGNTIAGSGQAGIFLVSSANSTVRGNEIFRNRQIPIDLSGGPAGSTPNDPGDSDSGPNGLQNYPDLMAATTVGNEVEISGEMDSAPNATFRVDVFASAMCRQGVFGEAERYVGTFDVTTGPTGLATFAERIGGLDPTESPFISATATDGLGNTSEVSYCVSLDELTLFREDFEAECRVPWQP